MQTSQPKIAASKDPLFQAASASLKALERAVITNVLCNLDSPDGRDQIRKQSSSDPQMAALANTFLVAREALSKYLARQYREANDAAAKAGEAYISRLLGVNIPSPVTLPVHSAHGRTDTETIESFSWLRTDGDDVHGSFNTSRHLGRSTSTRSFIIKGDSVSFTDD